MRGNQLAKALAPFGLIANKHALAPAYRSLQLSAGKVRGFSSYAALELELELPIEFAVGECVYVDAEVFLSVLKSLPDAELKIKLTAGVLNWSCGSAKGKIATIVIQDPPSLPEVTGEFQWEPTAAFYDALELGGLSCTNVALTSAGMYGIVIDNREVLSVFSSDNISVSAAQCGEIIEGAPEIMTFIPEAILLMRACLMYGEEEAVMNFTASEAEIYAGKLHAIIKQVPALKHDFRALMSKFATSEECVAVSPDRIATFIKRATALAESKKSAVVQISATSGNFSLSFEEGTASSEEYYDLAENELIPDIAPINFDSMRLARVLAHVRYIVFDHAVRSAIVLKNGEDEEVQFCYLLAGRS